MYGDYYYDVCAHSLSYGYCSHFYNGVAHVIFTAFRRILWIYTLIKFFDTLDELLGSTDTHNTCPT